jgi:formylglycine-generating enzyme required for sulfatase activity
MVYIPAGPFELGSADSLSVRNFSFFQSDDNGRPLSSFPVRNEESIQIGRGKDRIFYQVRDSIYQGDQRGVLPKAFPKGTTAFYMMKYELTQGQYAYFLNMLDKTGQQNRADTGTRDYLKRKGSIVYEDGVYRALWPNRPCNFISWDDACAFADFAGLRPFTEFEFEKAARGGGRPSLAAEFPWNTAGKDLLQRVTNKEGDYLMLNAMREDELSEETRALFGASYYWVMDLAGGVWERCITAGDSVGRKFSGTHGNGALSAGGFADNED